MKHTIFKSNGSQAVRLPKEMAFPKNVREVTIVCEGRGRVISPAHGTWDDFFGAPGIHIDERRQPETQVRESFRYLATRQSRKPSNGK